MVKRSRLLPDAEIRRLSRLWRSTGDREAIKRMVEANLGLAFAVARSYSRWPIPLEDLFHESVIGLIRGCERYDPDRAGQERITTFAKWWCQALVEKHVLKNSSSMGALNTRMGRELMRILHRNRGELTTEDMAEMLDRSVQDVDDVLMRTRPDVSLNTPIRHGADRTSDMELQDRVALDAPSPEDVFINWDSAHKLKGKVREALQKLPKREALIVRRRHMEERQKTLQEVGDELGLTRERVRQLELRAMDQLRKILKKAA